MLIDFTVENYRSIKDPVTLSAIAAPSRESARGSANPARRHIKPDNEIASAFPVEGRGFELLPVLGLFGANASGKSNVLRALDELTGFMAFGSSQQFGEELISSLFQSFKLNLATAEAPSRFQLRIALDSEIYIYNLSVNKQQIVEERLTHILPPPKRNRARLLFERIWNDDAQKFQWAKDTDLGNTYVELQETLKKYEPFMGFLTTRLQVASLAKLSAWLTSKFYGTCFGETEHDKQAALRFLSHQPQLMENVSDLVRKFDTGIKGITIRKPNIDSYGSSSETYSAFVLHDANAGTLEWPLEEESRGTQRLLILAHQILFTFKFGNLLLIDELDSNIHPNITREIVQIFQSKKTNPNGVQLIFTSHDNTLQQRNLLRRDQIWFTAKLKDGSTDLFPLTDFKPRNDLAIDKAYLDGRFGAVPILPDAEDLLPEMEPMK